MHYSHGRNYIYIPIYKAGIGPETKMVWINTRHIICLEENEKGNAFLSMSHDFVGFESPMSVGKIRTLIDLAESYS